MLAWSEGTDNGRPETEIMVMTCCRRRAIYWLLRSPSQTCHAKPKTQNQQAPDATSFFPVGGMPTTGNLAWKTSLRKSDAVALQQIKGVALYLWLIVVISVRQSTVAAISGLHCRALVMVSSSIRLTAWLQNSSRRNGQRDWCMSRVTAIISALVICIIVCLSWAVNHYRDNAITYKAQRDKMPENWSWQTRQLLTCRCVSVMLLRSMQNTRRS